MRPSTDDPVDRSRQKNRELSLSLSLSLFCQSPFCAAVSTVTKSSSSTVRHGPRNTFGKCRCVDTHRDNVEILVVEKRPTPPIAVSTLPSRRLPQNLTLFHGPLHWIVGAWLALAGSTPSLGQSCPSRWKGCCGVRSN